MTATPDVRRRSPMMITRLIALAIFCGLVIAAIVVTLTGDPSHPSGPDTASGQVNSSPVSPDTESREK